MQGNFKECLDLVLKSEGGFVNNPADPGGMTNLGVTKRVWEEYTGHEADEKTMRGLTPEKVAPLYEQRYWRPTYCEVLPRGFDLLIFSMGINAGPGRAVKLLQSAIGCVPDGVIGSTTMGLIKQSNVANIIAKYSDARRVYYQSLKTFPIFGKGWLNRVDHEETQALQMAKNG
jgi:lysozyme family protein